MAGRRGRRRKQLLNDLKRKRGYWILKEGTLDRTLWRTRIAKCCGPVLRQTTELMDDVSLCFLNNMGFDTVNIVPVRLEAVSV
jgi:hypothetical protein